MEHNVTRIGFFHFVADYADPLRALQAALCECGDIEGSLIVLPEGFNNGIPYDNQTPTDQKRKAQIDHLLILQKLKRLAKSAKAVFVVGILDGVNNSAYFVESGRTRLMCHKQANDCSGNYTPRTANCDNDNPIDLPEADVSIMTLICSDFSDWRRLNAMSDKCVSGRRILCIPASMGNDGFSGDSYCNIKRLLGKYVVLANSKPPGWASCGSFIGNTKGQRMVQCGRPDPQESNRIRLRSWAELDEDQTA